MELQLCGYQVVFHQMFPVLLSVFCESSGSSLECENPRYGLLGCLLLVNTHCLRAQPAASLEETVWVRVCDQILPLQRIVLIADSKCVGSEL